MNVRGFDPGLGTRVQSAAGPEKPSVFVRAATGVEYFLIHYEEEFWRDRMRRGERIGFCVEIPCHSLRAELIPCADKKNTLPCSSREFIRKQLNSQLFSRQI